MKKILIIATAALLFQSCSKKKEDNSDNSTSSITTIAFGSCGDQRNPQPVLERVVEKKPDVFLYLGDNIYADTYSMDTLKMDYDMLGAKPEFQKLKASTKIYAIWDDHDFGWNDSGRHYPFKKESKEIFLNFFGDQGDSTIRQHEGIYHTAYLDQAGKKIQIIFPDLRTFRDKLLPYNGNRKGDARFNYAMDYSPYTTADSTMMGEEQWRWMEEQLKVPADLRIMASSTQFSITHNGYEAWANFPHEQKRMVELIKKTKAEGVIFISGDVHYAEISKLVEPGLYPLYDVTASGITSTWDFAAPNDNRIDGAVMENHFGLLKIDWSLPDPEITMQIHDVSGKERISRIIKLSELKF
ncbi:MAG: alkaline phosphatase D family protein [Chryseolinea sp.]